MLPLNIMQSEVSHTQLDVEELAKQFDFFQAIRLLEMRYLRCEPESDPVGTGSNQLISFDATLINAFSPTLIDTIKKMDARSWKVTTGFMGLYGPHGVLPEYFTNLILKSRHASRYPLKDFLDIFGNRLTSLYYRAWKKNRFYVSYDENKTCGSNNFLEKLFLHLTVKDMTKSLLNNTDGLISFTAMLTTRYPIATNLKKLLAHYFAVPVTILQSDARWTELTPEQSTLLSMQFPHLNQLGKNSILGSRVFDSQNEFEISMGPLSYKRYVDFFTDKILQHKLQEIIQAYIGFEYACKIRFIVQYAEVPQLTLSCHAPIHLGWNSWLKSLSIQGDTQGLIRNINYTGKLQPTPSRNIM